MTILAAAIAIAPAAAQSHPSAETSVMQDTLLSQGASPHVLLSQPERNTIDPIATVTGGGRQIIMTGPIRCDQSQRVSIGVTVTQRSTGALAEGETQFTCTVDTQHWEVRASIRGNETFQAGAATAVAVGRTTDRGVTDDAHQWLAGITLAKVTQRFLIVWF